MLRWLLLAWACPLLGHDIVTTRLTWSREISRVVYHRCASCHRPGGSAPMSLLTYEEARPWARSMAEEVLDRRMPPWNPVKGFGEFKHDAGLSQEEIGLIAEWVEGGAPRGEDRYLPPQPSFVAARLPVTGPRLAIADRLVLQQPLLVRAIAVTRLAEGGAVSVWAETPDGESLPLLEIAYFRATANQPYEFAQPLRLASGTRLRVAGLGSVSLISSGALPARQSGPSVRRPPVAPAATRDARPAAEKSR